LAALEASRRVSIYPLKALEAIDRELQHVAGVLLAEDLPVSMFRWAVS